MNLLEHLDELGGLPGDRVGLFVDFDGTISHLAPTPDDAVVSPRAANALRGLSGKLALVCAISGRGVSDLRAKVGIDELVYVGNHGGEKYEAESLVVAPGMAEYEKRIVSLLSALRRHVDSPGIIWENKKYSAAVHFRATDHPTIVKSALAEAVSIVDEVDGLQVFWGKMLLEIRIPNGVHKGDALRELVREHRLDAAIFLGDDMTDLDAMETLRDMREHDGLRGISAVVADESTPEVLLSTADYTLNGVSSVEILLDWLLSTSQGDSTTAQIT
ncbi:MAG: trehalose-phosphatase [SAR202 cluster bacterium]|nr:trehalose-phosphatase [SAR202 cluster bacterium]